MVTDQIRAFVRAAGATAGRLSADITDCPFDHDTPAERELARIWVGGYLAARPPRLDSVDYSLVGGDQ